MEVRDGMGTGVKPLGIDLEQRVMTPLGVKQPIHKGHLRPLKNTDMYNTIQNSKISYEAAMKMISCLEVTTA